MQPRHFFLTLIAVALFGGSFIYVTAPTPQFAETYSEKELVQDAEVTNLYTIPILSDVTVLEAMNALASNSNFSFSGRDFPGIGLFVEEIGGKKNGGGFYWTLFINNELSEIGATQAEVSPNDIVEWHYESR